MKKISVTEFRRDMKDAMHPVFNLNERIILTHGSQECAVIPMKDYEKLKQADARGLARMYDRLHLKRSLGRLNKVMENMPYYMNSEKADVLTGLLDGVFLYVTDFENEHNDLLNKFEIQEDAEITGKYALITRMFDVIWDFLDGLGKEEEKEAMCNLRDMIRQSRPEYKGKLRAYREREIPKLEPESGPFAPFMPA